MGENNGSLWDRVAHFGVVGAMVGMPLIGFQYHTSVKLETVIVKVDALTKEVGEIKHAQIQTIPHIHTIEKKVVSLEHRMTNVEQRITRVEKAVNGKLYHNP